MLRIKMVNKSGNYKDWVNYRVLGFLNQARDVSDITDALIENHPGSEGTGKVIGSTVAQRIIDHKMTLPGNRYKDLEEVLDVAGFGEDKMNDLLFSFKVPADEAFKTVLSAEYIIGENWNLKNDATIFADKSRFDLAVTGIQAWVADKVMKSVQQKKSDPNLAYIASTFISQSYLERFDSAHFASHALALWFYRFDADNWFTFERIQNACERYLNYHFWPMPELDLLFFKGFPNGSFLSDGISADDLPVVINKAEQTITIWSAELFD